jgi:zinc transporter ZupT
MTLEKITKLKIGYIFVLLVVNFAGMMPIKWKAFRANPTFLSILNSFAGGVFLAMAFVHILPESVATYIDVMYADRGLEEVINNRRMLLDNSTSGSSDNSTATCPAYVTPDYPRLFPVPYLLFLCGYGLVLLVDRIAKGGDDHDHGHSHAEGDDHNHFPDLD